MEYYFKTILHTDFDESVKKATEALKAEGFGVISEIDIQAKLRDKLGVDFRKYLILGACNPPYAYRALLAEEMIGTMLPCNVVVIDQENGNTMVAAVNPLASMIAVQNPSIEPIALEITEKLKKVIRNLK